MAIKFDKLFVLLESSGKNKNYLRKNGIHANTVDRLLHNQSVNTDMIDRICALLNCQPSDIMEYQRSEDDITLESSAVNI